MFHDKCTQHYLTYVDTHTVQEVPICRTSTLTVYQDTKGWKVKQTIAANYTRNVCVFRLGRILKFKKMTKYRCVATQCA